MPPSKENCKIDAVMSSKKDKRLEAKKRKAAAFLELARLNDQDGSRSREAASALVSSPSKVKKTDERSSGGNPPRLTDKPLLEGKDYLDLKAELRARKKALKSLPKFDLKSKGHDASVDVPQGMRTPRFLAELRTVLAYTMVGDRVPYGPFTWCKVEKWNQLKGVVCLLVEGLSVRDFVDHRDGEEIAKVDRIFAHKLEFLSASSYQTSLPLELSILPVGSRKKKSLIKTYGEMENALKEGAAFRVNRSFFPMKEKDTADKDPKKEKRKEEGGEEEDPLKLRLLLSAQQMIEENYPLPLPGPMQEKYKDYVLTCDRYEEARGDSPVFSVDCEMCMTVRRRTELTRICVVDSELNVVYHSLVKPRAHITNYLTRYSGITKDMLVNVDTRLEDVQEELRRIIPPDAILVGQSLNSDLHALQMMHPYVIDTSIIYNLTGIRRRKTKLSVLASKFLKQEIQSKLGHNPIEDAQAAMKLVNLKLEKGYEYGDVLLDGTAKMLSTPIGEEGDDDEEGGDGDKGDGGEDRGSRLATSLLDQMKECGKTAKVICQRGLAGKWEDIPGYKEQDMVVECDEDGHKAAIRRAQEAAGEHDMVFCHVRMDAAGEVGRRLRKARKMTEALWSRAPPYSMLFTVWAGDAESNALVGVAMKRPEKNC